MTKKEEATQQFGTHLMVDGYGIAREILEDVQKLTKMLKDVPEKIGVHPLCEPVVLEVEPQSPKDPGGLSGFVIIAESHISFHTFPKRGFITLDIYTCQNHLDSQKLVDEFNAIFNFTHVDAQSFPRGTKYPVHNINS